MFEVINSDNGRSFFKPFQTLEEAVKALRENIKPEFWGLYKIVTPWDVAIKIEYATITTQA